jgi:Mrp family chromosome partitioning ATPase/predicted Fe-Mo cluster-binding NifX family protein
MRDHESEGTRRTRQGERAELFGVSEQERLEYREIESAMGRIGKKYVILSGKGGVGKSTVAVHLALCLSNEGQRVGLLDIDVHGPSIPKLLGIDGRQLRVQDEKIVPFTLGENLKVMSIGFLLQSDHEAVIWRGPMKYGVIKQFLKDVAWGKLDYLVIDSPPGTGDEPLTIAQLCTGATEAIIVTSPQDVAILDVKKSIQFCDKVELPVAGVIENMSGFVCPKCGEQTDIFKKGGGKTMAAAVDVPFLGAVPIDADLVSASDEGHSQDYLRSSSCSAQAFRRIVNTLIRRENQTEVKKRPQEEKGAGNVKIALPLYEGKLCMHFGHSETFEVFEVNDHAIVTRTSLTPPPHAPGVIPKFLKENGVGVIIAGGMGRRAQGFFEEYGIRVVVGAPLLEAEEVVRQYLDGTLQTGDNICDH